ncbi:MAG: transcriptional regulator PpsR [Maricaulaceae bacterium]
MMDGMNPPPNPIRFRDPNAIFARIPPTDVAALAAAAADVAVVLSADGVVEDIAVSGSGLAQQGFESWIGRPWVECVTPETRDKVTAMLKPGEEADLRRWRDVNHPSANGDVPVRYFSLPLGGDERVMAMGRDLRAMAELQQQLVAAQQSLERDYAQLRHAETRYRSLFQLTSEPVLIIEAESRRITEANPAAAQALGETVASLRGRVVFSLLHAMSGEALEALFASARLGGRVGDVRVRLAGEGGAAFVMSASMFRQDRSAYFLVRLNTPSDAEARLAPPKRLALQAIDTLVDGFVVLDPDLRVITANPAFLDLVQLVTEEQVRGEGFDRYFARPGVDLNILVSNLREHGAVRSFSTILQGAYGSEEPVEVSAVSVKDDAGTCYALMVRPQRRAAPGVGQVGAGLPRSVERLADLVGRVSLKDIVRETTELIEKLCIEAALELTGDNRASAAEVLGLSRQSLYAKLHRYGLGNLTAEEP